MNIDFSKYPDGLVPAIVQDAQTKTVLMLGYMNAEAVAKTEATQQVTFYSRSKNRLWTKGEESGNVLELVSLAVDCDMDALENEPDSADWRRRSKAPIANKPLAGRTATSDGGFTPS